MRVDAGLEYDPVAGFEEFHKDLRARKTSATMIEINIIGGGIQFVPVTGRLSANLVDTARVGRTICQRRFRWLDSESSGWLKDAGERAEEDKERNKQDAFSHKCFPP